MESNKPFYKRTKFWKWTGIALLALYIIGTISDMTGYSDKIAEEKAVVAAEDAKKREIEQAKKQAEKDAAKAEKEKAEKVEAKADEPPKTLSDAAKKVFGEHYIGIQNVGGTEEITVNLAQNLTQNLMLKGTYMDAVELGELVKDGGLLADADAFLLIFTTELTDQYGNTSVGPVVKITLGQATLDKINFANVSYNNIPKIADYYWHHPLFDK